MSESAEGFWEAHYGAREQVWSGRPNAWLVEVVAPLTPGSALDLGCGEGGDALWLAARGWRVTAVDVSETALRRARDRAAAAGVTVATERHDLARSFPGGRFDLVSAQFLQSPVAFPRDEVLRRAARVVAPGGLLLVVDHASAPPWAGAHRPGQHAFPPAAETLAALRLGAGWVVERSGPVDRTATGPDGEKATVTDTVVAARRRADVHEAADHAAGAAVGARRTGDAAGRHPGGAGSAPGS